MHDIARIAERGEEYLTLDALCEIAKLLTGAGDPIARMPSVFGVLASFMGLRHGALALLQEGSVETRAHGRQVNPYVVAATESGLPSHPMNCRAIPEPVARHVFRNGVALVSCDIAGEFGRDALPPGIGDQRQALVAVPIRDQANSPFVLGVLCAYRSLKDNGARFLDTDLRVMNMVAAVLEQSIRFRRLVARDRDRIVKEAQEAIRVASETAATAAEAKDPAGALEGVIGSSPAIRRVIAQVRKVAATHTPVLLRGESGTGKEVFARALHALSDRRDRPFIKVNCAALSQSLLESELFGHEKGSFTGAIQQKKGRFEMADGGTLFLDEIGEISLEFQAKLLRILQEGEFERVGGSRTLKVDVRLVTATNKDLERSVATGSFRADLYFRICVVPILLPPLRERKEDIAALAEGLLDRFNRRNAMKKRLHPSALQVLAGCNFPGNVRELENCIARVAALSTENVIHADDLACHHDHCLSADLWRLQTGTSSPLGGLAQGPLDLPVLPRRPAPAEPPAPPAAERGEDAERAALIEAMERAGWVQAKAARLLGQTPRQVGYALKKHNIPVAKF